LTAESEMPDDEILEGKTALLSEASAHAPSAELLLAVSDPTLTEDVALSLLKRPELPGDVIEQLAKNANVLESRKVKIALASHPHAPRHVSVPLARQLYTFDLMKVALSPGVPADVKIAVDDVLISRLTAVTTGERLTLARRASGRVAAALLADAIAAGKPGDGEVRDAETVARASRVMQAALENPRLTEGLVINSVLRPMASAGLVQAVAEHPKWSCRREIRVALLRTEYLSLARALEFGSEIPAASLQEILGSSRLPAEIKDQLVRENAAK
jgi:hypothetical protein